MNYLYWNNGDIVVSVVPCHKGQVFMVIKNYVVTPQAQVCAEFLNIETGETEQYPQYWFMSYDYDIYERMKRGESA